ncbi:hypothetical protein DFH05DRAFT_570064 [Lentinula detonsa]|uniref:Uncharacterized protein n=1 Tax=Lentinula detonsa TaxID=2804962 RepID=A0A9W8P7D1_9AGAR|nr:hypothetical protein DFH05DRAFT_570064 [Lentinula detonsa]
MNCPQRHRRGSAPLTSPAIREDESTMSLTYDASLSALNQRHLYTSTSLGYEPDRVKPFTHAFSDTCTPHVYHTSIDQYSGMSRSRYRPRQTIPSDVSTPLTYEKAVKGRSGSIREQEDPRRSDEAQSVHASGSNLGAVHAIDPACLRSIVKFDYACLEDLDEELILRPRSAFAELCWSDAVHNIPSSNNDSSSTQSLLSVASYCQPCAVQGVPRLSVQHIRPSIPAPIYPPQIPLMEIKGSKDFAAEEDSESECHFQTNSEFIRPPSLTRHSSVEESAMLMPIGRPASNRHIDVKLSEGESSIAGFPSESINRITSSYLLDHDSSANYQVDILRGQHSPDIREEESSNADVGSRISFQDGDDNNALLRASHPALISAYTFPHTGVLLCSSLHAYAGVANPQESIGLFPIPAAEFRTASNWKGRCRIKLASMSFTSSVSELCRTIFPVSRRIAKW